MVIIANSNLADILMSRADSTGADTYARSLQMAVRPDGQRSPLAGKLCAGLGRLAYECNQLDDADQYIRQCIDLCRQWGDMKTRQPLMPCWRGSSKPGSDPVASQAAYGSRSNWPVSILFRPAGSSRCSSDLARIWLAQGNWERLTNTFGMRDLKSRRYPLSKAA